MRRSVRAGALLAATLLASCGGEDATLQLLEVSPPVTEVTENLQADVTVTAIMDDGTRLDVTAEATWWVEDEAVATVSGGRVQAGSPGGTYLTAAWGGLQAAARVQVLPAVLLHLRLTTGDQAVAAGLVTHVAAEGDFSDGSVRDVTALVEWSTRPADEDCEAEEEAEEEEPIDVDDEGHLHGHYACALVLVASLGDVSVEAALTVTPAAPAALTLALTEAVLPVGRHAHALVTAWLTDGTTREVSQEATLAVADEDVAEWDDGRLQAEGVGTTQVRASWRGLTAVATLQVAEAALVSIQVIPPDAEVAPGRLLYFTAVGTYTDGAARDLTASLAWTTSSDVIAVSSGFIRQGAILARAAGTATVYATDPSTGLVGQFVLVIPRG